MLKYPCLVLDHDDTTVNSTATVHYPCFVEYMAKYFPHIHMTLEEYFNYNFDPGVVELFTKICGMTWEQMLDEEAYWKKYASSHVPAAYPGIREIMEEQTKRLRRSRGRPAPAPPPVASSCPPAGKEWRRWP